jgi:hypothetical protein
LHDLETGVPAARVPVQYATDGDGQRLVQQFPHPPGGGPARLIEPIPILATTSSRPLLDGRGLEELAVKGQRCSRALLPGAQLVEIEQAFEPFNHELHLPPHSIQRGQGGRGQQRGRQRGKDQHPLGEPQGAALNAPTFFLRLGPEPTPGFGGLRRWETAGRHIALDVLTLGARRHRQTPLDVLRRFEFLVPVDFHPGRIIDVQTVRVIPQHPTHAFVSLFDEPLRLVIGAIHEHPVARLQGGVAQMLARVFTGHLNMNQVQLHPIHRDVQPIPGPAHHLSVVHDFMKSGQRQIILQAPHQATQSPFEPGHHAAVKLSEAPMVRIGLFLSFFSSTVG